METRVVARRPGDRCPICRAELGAAEDVQVCPGCDTAHHRACVSEVGRCATLGCQALGAARPTARRRAVEAPAEPPAPAAPPRSRARLAAMVALALLALGWIPTLMFALKQQSRYEEGVERQATHTAQLAWRTALDLRQRGEFAQAATALRIAQPQFHLVPYRMAEECKALLAECERLAQLWPKWTAELEAIKAEADPQARVQRLSALSRALDGHRFNARGMHNPHVHQLADQVSTLSWEAHKAAEAAQKKD